MAAVAVVITSLPCEALARDVLAEIVAQAKLSDRDRAKITSEVTQRAKELVDAQSDAGRRKDARDTLVGTARVKNATPVGIEAYAEACADQLGGIVTNPRLEPALDAILVLVAIDHVNATNALATATLSPHAAVRYRAIRGIQLLQPRLAKDEQACRTALRALGRAGAAEQEELVLRITYEAVDFRARIPDFRFAQAGAEALNTVLASRLDRLRAGSGDAWKDVDAFAAAENYYPNAGAAQQSLLVHHVGGILSVLVDKYCDSATSRGSLGGLKSIVEKAEGALRHMMQASGVGAPSKRVSEALNTKKVDSASKQQAKEALADLQALLKKAPWNLP